MRMFFSRASAALREWVESVENTMFIYNEQCHCWLIKAVSKKELQPHGSNDLLSRRVFEYYQAEASTTDLAPMLSTTNSKALDRDYNCES